MNLDLLRERANELAIDTFYWDVEGERHEANPEALARVVDVVEADYSRSQGRRTHPIVLAADRRVGDGPLRVDVGGCDDAELLTADGEQAALTIDHDGVAVTDELPIGSHRLRLRGEGFDEFTTIVVAPPTMPRSAALDGATALFVPAYALWSADNPLPSFGHLATLARTVGRADVAAVVTLPLYAAFLDEPFDPSPYAPVSRLHWNEVYVDDTTLPPAAIPAPEELIDWRGLAARRRRQLLELAATFGTDTSLRERVARFVADRPDVADYARFRATVRPHSVDDGHPAATVTASYVLGQLFAAEQLAALETDGAAAIALDLPIGSHSDGYEVAAHPDLYATDMKVGAPPDALFSEGQDWGFPPQFPGEAERTGFDLWRQLIARCGEYTSMLRVDHLLGLHRLWWIPEGMSARDGVYVRYPRRALTSVIAAEAHRAGLTIVGEDLGTVPQEIIDLRRDWELLGLYAEQLLADQPLGDVPADTVAGLRTHDMPAFAELYARGELAMYRDQLGELRGRDVPDDAGAVLDAALDRLGRSAAYLVSVDLDDLVGERRPHNVPGMVLPETWRRRATEPVGRLLDDPLVHARLATLTTARRQRMRP